MGLFEKTLKNEVNSYHPLFLKNIYQVLEHRGSGAHRRSLTTRDGNTAHAP